MGDSTAEAADRLEVEMRSAAVLADDPLAPVLRASVDLGRAMAEAIDRLEKLGSKSLDEQVVAAVERAGKTIAFRIGGQHRPQELDHSRCCVDACGRDRRRLGLCYRHCRSRSRAARHLLAEG